MNTQKEELKDQLIKAQAELNKKYYEYVSFLRLKPRKDHIAHATYDVTIAKLDDKINTLTEKIEAEPVIQSLECTLDERTKHMIETIVSAKQELDSLTILLGVPLSRITGEKPEPAKSAEKPQCKFFPCKSVSDCTHCGDYLKPEPVGSAERVKFNVNHYVYIQINERGWKRLQNSVGADYITHCINPYRTVIKGEYWYRLQLHQVFELFPIDMAHPILFNPNIMFEVTESLQSNSNTPSGTV